MQRKLTKRNKKLVEQHAEKSQSQPYVPQRLVIN